MNESKLARRAFLRASLTAVAAVPLGAIPLVVKAAGEQLSEDDPQAAALGYRHDTSAVDESRFPQHKAEQHCANCQLFQGAQGDEWGGCAIFPGKQVSANGWCSAWVAKSS